MFLKKKYIEIGYIIGKNETIKKIRSFIDKEAEFLCDKGHEVMIDNLVILLNNLEGEV